MFHIRIQMCVLALTSVCRYCRFLLLVHHSYSIIMPNLGVFVTQKWAVVSRKGLNYVRNYSDLFLLLWQLKPHLPQIYKKPLIRQKIISYERVLQLFPNLEELILIHGEQMLCIAVEGCVVSVEGALRARGSRVWCVWRVP